jgi:adenylate cyclase class 2
MREIEVKVLAVDRDAAMARLREIGARCDFDGLMQALYFDTPDRRLSRRRDSLRLRREGSRSVLNFKAHVAETEMKEKEEIETDVGDFEAARAILLGLGYEIWLEMEKRRQAFVADLLPGVHFVFDRYLGAHAFVPEYLELEAPSQELLRKAVRATGFSMRDTVPWNAFEVIEHYRKLLNGSGRESK